MPPRARRFRKPLGAKRHRKLFVLRTEGSNTEPQYFGVLNSLVSNSHVVCLRGGHASSPPQVLQHMEAYLAEEAPRPPYEAWLVIDKDEWGNAQLASLNEWEQRESNYGLAISNPKFEYWLLLHFEDGNNIRSPRECVTRLRQHLPDYDKNIDSRIITPGKINDAIHRAKAHHNSVSESEPLPFGCTTVYKLVEKVLRPK